MQGTDLDIMGSTEVNIAQIVFLRNGKDEHVNKHTTGQVVKIMTSLTNRQQEPSKY